MPISADRMGAPEALDMSKRALIRQFRAYSLELPKEIGQTVMPYLSGKTVKLLKLLKTVLSSFNSLSSFCLTG